MVKWLRRLWENQRGQAIAEKHTCLPGVHTGKYTAANEIGSLEIEAGQNYQNTIILFGRHRQWMLLCASRWKLCFFKKDWGRQKFQRHQPFNILVHADLSMISVNHDTLSENLVGTSRYR